MRKSVRELLARVSHRTIAGEGADVFVSGVECDSRKVLSGNLFIAISGTQKDGHSYIRDALARGAAAVVAERKRSFKLEEDTPFFIVPDARRAAVEIAQAAYDFPARELKLIGITGTNGKTTTAFLARHLLEESGGAGLIGTVFYGNGSKQAPAENTTPGPLTLNRLFREMVEEGLRYCILEVSSHALDQGRTSGLPFSTAVFTNLSQDHFDYHPHFESYYSAKRRLFADEPLPARAVINQDDAYGRRLIGDLKRDAIFTYGLSAHARLRAANVRADFEQAEFELEVNGKEAGFVRAPLGFEHNVYNILAALAIAESEGLDLRAAAGGLASFKGVPGRLERIDEGQDFYVYVDYAHTPEAISRLLESARALKNGSRLPLGSRIITVFGCGGERDSTKRPLMGKTAAKFSDLVILTSDNSRGEETSKIISEIRAGMGTAAPQAAVLEIEDREQAIRAALEAAEAGDVVFLLGKGHENYQILGGRKIDFSDQEIARHYLKKKCSHSKKQPKFAAEG